MINLDAEKAKLSDKKELDLKIIISLIPYQRIRTIRFTRVHSRTKTTRGRRRKLKVLRNTTQYCKLLKWSNTLGKAGGSLREKRSRRRTSLDKFIKGTSPDRNPPRAIAGAGGM